MGKSACLFWQVCHKKKYIVCLVVVRAVFFYTLLLSKYNGGPPLFLFASSERVKPFCCIAKKRLGEDTFDIFLLLFCSRVCMYFDFALKNIPLIKIPKASRFSCGGCTFLWVMEMLLLAL